MSQRLNDALTFRDEPTPIIAFPQVMTPASAQALASLAEERASSGGAAADGRGFTLYDADPRASRTGAEDWPLHLRGRLDLAHTSSKHGGRFGRAFQQKKAGQFRDTFAYGDAHQAVQEFISNPLFVNGAREIHPGREIIEPHIIFGNFYLPGESQPIHTDVPEFRGASRVNTPEWLLVVMHHSGLFKKWYMPIATAVAWFSHHEGGELVYYPDPSKPGQPCPTLYNAALMMDTDSVYHGVDPVGSLKFEAPSVPRDASLLHLGSGMWQVVNSKNEVVDPYSSLTWKDIRMSLQWKAYCFTDEVERQSWRDHSDDLSPAAAYDTLVKEAVKRGRAKGDEPKEDMARILVCEFIRVPDELKQPHTAPAESKKRKQPPVEISKM